jgi:hypothetical protein
MWAWAIPPVPIIPIFSFFPIWVPPMLTKGSIAHHYMNVSGYSKKIITERIAVTGA